MSTLIAYWNPEHFLRWYGDIDEGGLDFYATFYLLKEPLVDSDSWGFDVSAEDGTWVPVSTVETDDGEESRDEEAQERFERFLVPFRVGEVVRGNVQHVPAWVEDGHFVCDFNNTRIVLAEATSWEEKCYKHGWWLEAVGYNPNRFSEFYW